MDGSGTVLAAERESGGAGSCPEAAVPHRWGTGRAVAVKLWKEGLPETASSFWTHQIEAVPIISMLMDFVFKEIEEKPYVKEAQFVREIDGIFAFRMRLDQRPNKS